MLVAILIPMQPAQLKEMLANLKMLCVLQKLIALPCLILNVELLEVVL